MDVSTAWAETPEGPCAIEFSGTMKEFLPIAISNFLLTIVTLTIYRSWAKARERRYLWNRTRFIDDQLQWTGSGLEMFIGFVMFAILLTLIGIGFIFGLPAAVSNYGLGATFGLLALLYLGGLFLYGLARFRALRYRLSRSYWRGIRGGSDDSGVRYGFKAIGYYIGAFLFAGIMYPWAQAKLWNERWNKMSYGPYEFTSELDHNDTQGAFWALWAAAVIGSLTLTVVAGSGVDGQPGDPGIVATLLFYAVVGLAYMNFQAHFLRAAASSTRFGDIEFRLDADTNDWFGFYMRTIGLAIVTLGLAMIVYNFRKWQFVTSRLEALGTIDLDELVQSTTHAPRDAEGLLDALDIGAF